MQHRNISASASSSSSLLRSVITVNPILNNAASNFTIDHHHRLHRRHIHASSTPYQGVKPNKPSQKDFFTPSPFARSPRINVNDKFAIFRDLIEGSDNVYGIRRYLLLSRSEEEDAKYYADNENYVPSSTTNIIASLNANRNVLFGAKLHANNNMMMVDSSSSSSTSSNNDANVNENEDYLSNYLAACGSLLDVAKIDASINGQQVQALATLNGLCSWVSECLENDGEGSVVLKGLMYGERAILSELDLTMNDVGGSGTKEETKKLPGGKRSNQRIETNYESSFTTIATMEESQRLGVLEAVRAIATGHPRPGHSVVGAGTYKDGRRGWVALAREYAQLAINPNALTLDASYVTRRGLEEVTLYKSRDGEITAIEHLAHTQPEYLREAGGAMARVFFV